MVRTIQKHPSPQASTAQGGDRLMRLNSPLRSSSGLYKSGTAAWPTWNEHHTGQPTSCYNDYSHHNNHDDFYNSNKNKLHEGKTATAAVRMGVH